MVPSAAVKWIFPVLVVTNLGCSEAPVPGEWRPCPSEITPQGASLECTDIEVPLDHEAPERRSIVLGVARMRARATPSAQLWMLQGGPGTPSSTFAFVGNAILQQNWPIDVYFLDHRGVGRSTPLECVQARRASTFDEATCAAELTADWGEDLSKFTTTQAARDLQWAIDRFRSAHPTVVYGVSYGAYWAHRYLQIAPEHADGVALDANCLSEFCRMDKYNDSADDGARQTLAACAADGECASRLTGDPIGQLTALLQKLKTGHCSATQVPGDAWRGILAELGRADPLVLPGVLHRLSRCNAEDLTALAQMLQRLGNFVQTKGAQSTLGLHLHIVASELTSDPLPSAEARQARDAERLVSSERDNDFSWVNTWPRYPREALASQWTTSPRPLLMMQGRLDFATSVSPARQAKDQLPAPNTTYVEFPWGGHGAAWENSCGVKLLLHFVLDPKAAIESGCASEPIANPFSQSDHASYWFGTDSIW